MQYVLKKIRILSLAFLLAARAAQAQTPDCFWLKMPVVAVQQGDTVCLPVQAYGFSEIVALQFELSWDTAALDFVRVDIAGSQLAPISQGFNFGLNNAGAGRIQFLWYDGPGESLSLPDGAFLFSVCLKAKTSQAVYAPVALGSGPAFFYEAVNASGTLLNRAIQEGGVITGGLSGGDGPRFDQVCIGIAECGQQSGAITPQISGGEPPYAYQWSGPNGFLSNDAALNNLAGGEYALTVTDAAGAVLHGSFSVNATHSPVQVKAVVEPAFCGLPNGCARLTVSGGAPPYAYHWPDGAPAGPERCDLLPGSFTITVSDANGCARQWQVDILNDTLLQVEQSVQHIQACNGTGGAALTVSGGLPPYQFNWSTGDTSAAVSGLAAGRYTVTITAGAGCTATREISVTDYSVYYWNLQLIKYCPEPDSVNGSLTLKFNKSGGIDFPVIVSWSDGTTRMIAEKPANGVLDSLVGIPSGAYSVMVTDTGGCVKTASTVLNCLSWSPVADTLPGFYIKDDYLNPQYGLDSCAGVYARQVNGLTGLDLSLSWPANVTRLRNLRYFGLPGLKSDDFVFSPDSSKLGMRWTPPGGNPVSLPGPVLLFEACFEPKHATITNSALEFSDTPVLPRMLDASGADRGFIGLAGTVLFNLWFPAGPSVCDFGLAPPSCASDGYGRVLLEPCKFDRILSGGYTHDGVFINSLEGLLFADTGVYAIRGNQPGKSSSHLLARIPWAPEGSSDCIWPGDADDNNAVNHYDLLYLGLGFGASGPLRPAANVNWLGQEAPDWSQSTGARQVNFKNIDTNGDGFIDAADTAAITQNWGRVVNMGKDDPFATSLNGPDDPFFPAFKLKSDTLTPGQMATLPLSLGSPATPVDSVLGLAFSISYDPEVVQTNVLFVPAHSWLGNPETELLWVQRNFPAQGRVDVAITRTDGQPVSGAGLIGDMIIVIEDNIFTKDVPGGGGNDPADTTRRTLLFFSGLHTVGAEEDGGQLAGSPVELIIRRPLSGVADQPAWSRRIVLSPNPANEKLRISSPVAEIHRAEIWNADGHLLAVQNSDGSAAMEIPCATLLPGVYFARLYTGQGVSVQLFTVSH